MFASCFFFLAAVPQATDKIIEKIGFYHSIEPPMNSLSSLIEPILLETVRTPWMDEIFQDPLTTLCNSVLTVQGFVNLVHSEQPLVRLYLEFLVLAQSIYGGLASLIPSLDLRLPKIFDPKLSLTKRYTPKHLFYSTFLDLDCQCRLFRQKTFNSKQPPTQRFLASLNEACQAAFYFTKSPLKVSNNLQLPRLLTSESSRLILAHPNSFLREEITDIRNKPSLSESLIAAVKTVEEYKRSKEPALIQFFKVEAFRLLLEYILELLIDSVALYKKNEPWMRYGDLQSGYFFMVNSLMETITFMRLRWNTEYSGLDDNINTVIKNVSLLAGLKDRDKVIAGFKTILRMFHKIK
jgi:hypothetical protein